MVFDAHSDIWTDVTIRSLKGESDIFKKYHLERLQKGNIEGGIFVIWIDPPHATTRPYERFLEIAEAIKKEVSVSKDFVIVKNYDDIQKAKAENKFYIIIGAEGLSSIGENLDLIDTYYDLGARHAMLTWNEQNALATGAKGDETRGITKLGKKAVQKIVDKKMILDVSHLNEKSFWDVTELVEGPVIASHSNAKALCNVARNLSDEQLLRMRDLDAVIGINAFNEFIHNTVSEQTIDNFVKHAVYIADKIGVEHVGSGFDFFEFLLSQTSDSFTHQDVYCTKGLEDCSKVPDFIQKLKQAGFSDKEIDGICYGNFHRVIKKILV